MQLHDRIKGLVRRLTRDDPPEVVVAVREQRLSYLSSEALRDLFDAAEAADRERHPGVFLEAGCALGGSAIVLATAKRRDRPLYVHDVFDMIPPPGEQDGDDVKERYQTIVSGNASGLKGDRYYGYEDDLVSKVTANFQGFGLSPEDHNVHLVRGLFEDTIVGDEPVALAHIDGDWYDSVRTCLERLAPRLVPGGIMIIDDYAAWSGCRTAVDEFLSRNGELFVTRQRARLQIQRRP